MTNADEAAFPRPLDESNSYGLSKREYLAGLAMQGLLACNPKQTKELSLDQLLNVVAQTSIMFADALLSELAKPKEATP